MKNSNDTIGNRTRDLPACSAVPQPTYMLMRGDYLTGFKEKQCISLCSAINLAVLMLARVKKLSQVKGLQPFEISCV